jgi:hypothetical protein
MQPGPAIGAQCAIHTGVGAPSVCARCGNFMCTACSVNQTERLCPTCRALTQGSDFPLGPDADFDQVWNYCFERFKAEWLMLSVGVLLFVGVAMMAGLMSNIITTIINKVMNLQVDPARPFANLRDFAISNGLTQVTAGLLNIPITGVGLIGIYRMCLDVLDGRKADVGRMFTQLNLLPKYVVLQLIMYAVITVPTYIAMAVLGFLSLKVGGLGFSDLDGGSLRQWLTSPGPFIVAGGLLAMVAALLYVLPLTIFGVPELLVSQCNPLEAIRRAWQMADGQRLRLVGYSFVGAAVMLVGALACCVGMLPASALLYMLWLSVFLTARKRTSLPPPMRV